MRKKNKSILKKENKKKVIPGSAVSHKRKILEGEVCSSKMQKTVVVKVFSKYRHSLYSKVIKKTTKFMAHTDKELAVGTKVTIEQCRPLSKRKRWRVISVLQ